MSFNLERFRFMREKSPSGTADSLQARSGSTSPDSEKENKPVRESSLATFTKKQEQDTTGLDSEDPLSAEIVVKRHQKIPKRLFDAHSEENKEREEKVAQLTEMFPQRSRGELLEAISSTSTLDGAVAFCLMAFKDEGTTQKRKNDASDSDSQDSADVQPHKKRKKDPETEEPMQDPSSGQQKAMVKKLQKAFPNLDKEELREVLHEHEWQVEEAIEVLRMFSDPEESSSSPEVVKEPKSKPSKLRVESSSKKPVVLSDWLTGPKGRAPSPAIKPSPNRMMKAFSKKGRNQRAHSESGSEGEDSVNSDFEGSSNDDDSDQEDGMSQTLKESILEFLQEASLDELSLISSCSLKKAQKIVELRPFHTWEDLKEVFHKVNGLSEELLWGCKVVLKERAVVLGLMGKCETISRKMLRHVNSVIQSGTGSMKQPAILNSKLQLKPYQLIGLNWLALLHRNNLSGILADEMGLGKTIQAVSFLASLYEDGIEGPHLITVPSSTLDNWVRELKLWCPSLKVLVYYGSVDDRKYLRYDILNKQVDFNVIISTYNLAIGNESDRSLFRKLKLQCAVFDEGHMLKNMNSLRYRHLMAIKAQYRLLLTGTPLQNNLLELISLLNFIMPSMFSSSTSQIAKMFSMKSSEEQSSFEKDRITQAKQIMKPFILRRVKSEVLKQLPAKEETVEFCRMSEKQQQLYLSLMEKLKRSATDEKKVLNNVMMQLRKMANHPLLHRQYYTSQKLTAMSKLMLKEPTHHDANPILIKEDMEVMSDFELHNLCQQYSSLNGFELERPLLLDSGKFALLTELLASLKEQGDRVVLFSQFTMMLDILEVLLQCLGHRYVRLDGSTPMADRIVLIDQYNTEPEIFVFLLSTRAGGLGINLTSANVVILHDIDCNPYNDKQAEDRCHRVGQTRVVRVIKLISQDSIEDCMLRAGQKKLKLEQDMTAGTEGAEGDISDDMASLLKASLGL